MPEKELNPKETANLVNRVGQYLYKTIDGAYKGVRSTNTYDVYTTVLYQVPDGSEDMKEMDLNISLTTYQGKIRINVTELSPEEWTFGFILIPPDKLRNLEDARELILNQVVKALKRRYENYNFLF